jgi:transposase
MPAKIYRVTLTIEEQRDLRQLVSQGNSSARKITRGRILLLADENNPETGFKDDEIVKALNVSARTVERTRKSCVEEGLEAAINHKRPYRRKPKSLDGKAEAYLVATTCSPAPEGRERWTLQLLADKLVELNVVDTVSTETVRRTLKKMNLSLG